MSDDSKMISIPPIRLFKKVLKVICVICGVLFLKIWFDTPPPPSKYKVIYYKPKSAENLIRWELMAAPKTEPKTYKSYKSKVDQSVYPLSDYKHSVNLKGKEFWESHKPSFACPSSLLERIGRNGDGGKWICGLENLGKASTEGYNCTVYSFGVYGESSFEAEILQNTQCSVYGYDPNNHKFGGPIKSGNLRAHYQPLGLGWRDFGNIKTLKTLMAQNGHKFIDILKIDVEGSEYDSLERMLMDFDELPFGQLVVELHNVQFTQKSVNRVLKLISDLEKKGARVFSTEPNPLAICCCSEYSFINLNYRKLFYPDNYKLPEHPEILKNDYLDYDGQVKMIPAEEFDGKFI